MAEMIFFSNPECSSSNQHRAHLEGAGNTLLSKDLTSHPWTYEELLPFVRGRAPLDIMNSSAPDIQEGRIDPLLLTFEQALLLLVEKPVLIKGPLIHVDNLYIQGLQDRRLEKYFENTLTRKTIGILYKRITTVRQGGKEWQRQYTDSSELSYSFV